MAARGARAAASDAGDWVFISPIGRAVRAPSARIPPGPEGDRLRRGREHRDRIPLGGGPIRSAAGTRGGIGSPTGCRHRRPQHGCDVGGQGGYYDDPHRLRSRRGPGEVRSRRELARPGGNLTGINFFSAELVAKRLELLRELVPRAARVAVLIDPSIVGSSERAQKEVEAAARALGLQIQILNATSCKCAIDLAADVMGTAWRAAPAVEKSAGADK